MATSALYQFLIKTPSQIRDDGLRTLRNGLIRFCGIAAPNVAPGSDYYVLFEAFAGELAPAMANCALKADENMPDTASGTALERICAPFLGTNPRRAAGPSAGNIQGTFSQSTGVVVGATLIAGTGVRYQVTVGGTYANGDLIPVQSIDVGTQTNQLSGTTLTWTTPPTYSQQTAAVSVSGLTGGVDAEDDESLRARLFAYLQNAPESGDAQDVADLAEASTTLVQKAFVYPAAQGPATYRLAVAGAITRDSKGQITSMNRDANATVVTNTVDPFVGGEMPEHAHRVTTTVTNVNTDVAVGLTLPAAPTASPPGPGGGWLDGTPWPNMTNAVHNYVAVTVVTSTTDITLDAQTAPTAGVSHIAWLSPYDWKLYTAIVTGITSNVAGAMRVTLDTPLVGVQVGCFIFPQCTNMAQYLGVDDASKAAAVNPTLTPMPPSLLMAFALMGPGEVTSNATVLSRAFRHPVPSLSWPSTLGAVQLKQIETGRNEVLSTQWLYRSTTTPAVPGAVTTAPAILVPRFVGLYPNP